MHQELLTLIYSALDDIEAKSIGGAPVEKAADTPLLGSSSGVDSLTFVNLIVALEARIQEATGRSVVLVDEDSMAADEHPFRTIGSLAVYAEKFVEAPERA
jgi:hypothetical protein